MDSAANSIASLPSNQASLLTHEITMYAISGSAPQADVTIIFAISPLVACPLGEHNFSLPVLSLPVLRSGARKDIQAGSNLKAVGDTHVRAS